MAEPAALIVIVEVGGGGGGGGNGGGGNNSFSGLLFTVIMGLVIGINCRDCSMRAEVFTWVCAESAQYVLSANDDTSFELSVKSPSPSMVVSLVVVS